MDEKELIKSLEIFAHKIKNPIHAVGINLDVLKIKLQKQGNDQATMKHLEIANSEAKRLSDIIEKYLKYVKLNEKERAKKDLKKLLG